MEVDENSADNMTVIRNDMIDHLVGNSEIVFKSQQLREPDLTGEEKRKIVEQCLKDKPLNFLARFSRYMEKPHFEYIKKIHPECDYEIGFYLKENSAQKSETVVKNRRLEAMKRLALEGDYFTEEEMRKRNPLLYEQLVGKYLTEDEKRDKNSFNHTMNKEDGGKLSSLLMEQYERDIAADLRKEQEDAEEEIESDSDDELKGDPKGEDDRVLYLWGESKSASNYIDVSSKITEGEKKLLFEEFRSHMYRDFIGGRETDFDYSNVDTNMDYDDLDELDRDAEDKYFSSDTPEDVEMESEAVERENQVDSSENLGENAQIDKNNEVVSPPINTCEEIPSVNIAEPTEAVASSNLDEVDPLDLYMSQLEEEHTNQQLNAKMKNTVIS